MNPKFTKIRTSITQLSLDDQLKIHAGVQARRLIRREIAATTKRKKVSATKATKMSKDIKKIKSTDELDALIAKLKADKAKKELL